MKLDKPLLIVITGPTGSGKTALSIRLAKYFNCEIISADSRQIFKELSIGSAAPDTEELAKVSHHLVADLSVSENFNAGMFEQKALVLLKSLFTKNPVQIVCGGSGMYIKALLYGLDEFPEISSSTRENIKNFYHENGLEALQKKLFEVDPEYYAEVDIQNPQRMMRALEVFESSGRKFSSFKTKNETERFFDSIVIATDLPRNELYERINQRTLTMFKMGWLDECKSLMLYRHKNALQTVGYKEIFDHLDGKISFDECVSLIQQNTRRYAKRQVTYIKHQLNAHFFHPDDFSNLKDFIVGRVPDEKSW